MSLRPRQKNSASLEIFLFDLTHKKVEGTDPNKLFANTIGGDSTASGGKRRWGVTHPATVQALAHEYPPMAVQGPRLRSRSSSADQVAARHSALSKIGLVQIPCHWITNGAAQAIIN